VVTSLVGRIEELTGEQDALVEKRVEELFGEVEGPPLFGSGGDDLDLVPVPKCCDRDGKELKTSHAMHLVAPWFFSVEQEQLFKGKRTQPVCYSTALGLIDTPSLLLHIVRNQLALDGLMPNHDKWVWLWGVPGKFPDAHVQMPHVSPAAEARHVLFDQDPSHCQCELGVCGCTHAKVAFVGIHCLRLDMEDMEKWTRKLEEMGATHIYAVVPVLGSKAGSLYQDISWKWNAAPLDNPTVEMGYSDTGYAEVVQNPSHWYQSHVPTTDVKIVLSKVAQLGAVRVVRLVRYYSGLEAAPLSHLDYNVAARDADYIGPVKYNPCSVGLGTTTLRSAGDLDVVPVPVWSVGDMFLVRFVGTPLQTLASTYTPQGSELQWVPKDLIAHLAKFCSGLPRNQKLYNQLHTNLRSWCRSSNMTWVGVNVNAAVPLAMELNFEAEAAAASACLRLRCDRRNSPIDAASIETPDPKIYTPLNCTMALGGLFALYTARKYLAPMLTMDKTPMAATLFNYPRAFLAAATLTVLSTRTLAQPKDWPTPISPISVLSHNVKWILQQLVIYIRRSIASCFKNPFSAAWDWWSPAQPVRKRLIVVNKHCPGHPGPVEIDPTSVVTPPPEYTPVECLTKKVAGEVVGFYVPSRPPVYPTSCMHSDRLALMHRQLGPLTHDPELNITQMANDARPQLFPNLPIVGLKLVQWTNLDLVPLRAQKIHVPVYATVDPTPFPAWVVRFPEGRRTVFELARLDKTPLLTSDGAKIKSFVKFEASSKFVEGEGFAPLVPRNISSREPIYQVRTGPWTHALSKFVAEQWSPDNPPQTKEPCAHIIYTSGLDAGQLGTAYSEAIFKANNYLVIENDFSRFDGSLCPEMIAAELAIYASFEPPDLVWDALQHQLRCDGVSSTGFKFRGEGRRKSGDGNTSVGNSILNAMAHVEAIKTAPWFHAVDWANSTMFVLGDDNLLVLSLFKPPGVQLPQLIKETCQEKMKRMGLRPKTKVHTGMGEPEFCSGMFYPVLCDGDPVLVWGPKIGRVLYKTGVVKADGDELKKEMRALAEYRGTLLGLMQTVAHIPVLGALFKSHLAFLDRHGVTKAIMPEKMEHQIRATKNYVAYDATWNFVAERYGISRAELENLDASLVGAPMRLALGSPYHVFTDVDIPAEDDPDPTLTHLGTPIELRDVPLSLVRRTCWENGGPYSCSIFASFMRGLEQRIPEEVPPRLPVPVRPEVFLSAWSLARCELFVRNPEAVMFKNAPPNHFYTPVAMFGEGTTVDDFDYELRHDGAREWSWSLSNVEKTFAAPIWEEFLKRKSQVFSVFIVLFEAARATCSTNTRPFSYWVLMKAIQHYSFKMMPYPFDVVCHSLHNFVLSTSYSGRYQAEIAALTDVLYAFIWKGLVGGPLPWQ